MSDHITTAKDELRDAMANADDERIERGLNHVLDDLSQIQRERRKQRGRVRA